MHSWTTNVHWKPPRILLKTPIFSLETKNFCFYPLIITRKPNGDMETWIFPMESQIFRIRPQYFHSRPQTFHFKSPFFIGYPSKICCLHWQVLGYPKKIFGSPIKIWGSTMNLLGSPKKIQRSPTRILGSLARCQWRSPMKEGLQCWWFVSTTLKLKGSIVDT